MTNKEKEEHLRRLQKASLLEKELLTQQRIREWYLGNSGNVVVSFSGGKDSTVLLHLVRSIFPNVKAVFSDTGLEYPEIRQFVKGFDNVDIVRPKMNFAEVISTYGYPLISKEVSEAIYYARRIRSQSRNVERERTAGKKREELHGERQANTQSQGVSYRQTDWKRPEMRGTRRRAEISGTLTMDESLNRQRRTWVVNGQTGEGGVFSNPKKQFGEASMFNKEKYLPLARDIPVPISHYCCQVMKKGPMKAYQRKNHLYPYLGTLAEESRVRKQAWIRHGCNAFESKNPTSQPLSFWTEQDILHYIVNNGLEIASVYGDIVAVDADGWEYEASTLLDPKCKLQCSGCDRTGQINAAR